MDDIEYLEEYEGLIMPAEGRRTVGDDDSSSSLDQDLFESLFDGQSDDENEVLPKKLNEQGKRRQVRESLDSLDMLVRDLGEQVSVQNEQQKCRSINESSSMQVNTPAAPPKPIIPCLKKNTSDGIHKSSKSSDGQSSSQGKPQKCVMFANLPTVKRSSSSSSSTYPKEKLHQNPFSGRKPIHNARTDSDVSKGSDSNSQRKLNRPQLTIVRPEKIQFKDPVDDPLSLEKVEHDMECFSDVSDDSFASLSEICVTPQDMIDNENESRKVDCEKTPTTENAATIQSPPTPISTAYLPEKVTIISDTVLSRIDTALLESLATDESKEIFSKEHKLKDDSAEHATKSTNLEIVQPESSYSSELDINKTITGDEIIEESFENTLTEISDGNVQFNESGFSEKIEEPQQDNAKSPNLESEIVENSEEVKNVENKDNNNVEKEVTYSKDSDIEVSAEKSKESDIIVNIPKIIQATVSEKEPTDPSKENESNAISLKNKDVELKDQEDTPLTDSVQSSEGVVKSVADNVAISKDAINSQKCKDDSKSKEQPKTFQTNKAENSSLSKTPEKAGNRVAGGQTDTLKKSNVAAKPETQKSDQKTQETTKASTPKKLKTNATPSRSQEQRKEVSKEHSKTTVNQSPKTIAESPKKQTTHITVQADSKNTINQSQKTKEKQSKEPLISKPVPESPKKETQKISSTSESAKKKVIQKADSKKEEASKTLENKEKRDLSNKPSSSAKIQQSRSTTNQSGSSGQNASTKSNEASNRKDNASIVQKQIAQKAEKIEKPKPSQSTDTQRNANFSRDNSNVASTSTGKNRDSINSKEKRYSSSQQKTTPQTQKKIENKVPPSKPIEDVKEKKKEETKEINLKQSEDKQRKKEPPKKEESKPVQTKKVVEGRKPCTTDAKIENSKLPKETEVAKMKSPTKIGLKADKSDNRDPKAHVDNKQTPSSNQKLTTQPKKNADQVNVVSKQNEKSPTNNSLKKDITEPKIDQSSITNVDKKTHSETVRSSLKRENSMTTIDNSKKRLRSTSSSADDSVKSNKPNESDSIRNSKKEDALKKMKPSNVKEETVTPKLLNRKSLGNNSSGKNKTLDTQLPTQSKILGRDHKTDSVKTVEAETATTSEKNSEISALTGDKSKSLPSKTESLPSNSTSRSNKTVSKTSDLTMPSIEVPSVAKKPNMPASPIKRPGVVKATMNTLSNDKSTLSKEKSVSTPSVSSGMVTKDRKINEVSSTSMSLDSKIDSITTVVSSKTEKDQQHVLAVSSTSIEDEKTTDTKTEAEVVKNVPLNDEQKVCNESSSNNVTNIAGQKNKNNTNPNNRRKQITKNTSTPVQEKKVLSEKVSSSAKNVQAIQSIEPSPIEAPNDISREKEQIENEGTATDSVSDKTKRLDSIEGLVETKEAKNLTSDVDIQEQAKRMSTTVNDISSKHEEEIGNSPCENTKNMLGTNNTIEREKEAHSNINQSSIETIVKDIEENTRIVLQRRSADLMTSYQRNVIMETGRRRQSRKRGVEALTSDESNSISSKISIDKSQATTSSNTPKGHTKSTLDNSPVLKQTKKKAIRKYRRGRQPKIAETPTELADIEQEKSKTSRQKTAENCQNYEANTSKKLRDQTVPNDAITLSLQSQTDQASKDAKVPDENLKKTVVLNTDVIEPALLATEIPKEVRDDSTLDRLSMTSVESAAFSGFASSPVNASINEKSSELIVTASKSIEHNSAKGSSKDENIIPNSTHSPTASTKSAMSAVITFNEWLARKSVGQSMQEKITENKEMVETSTEDITVDSAQTSNITEELNKSSKDDDSKILSETTKASPKNFKPQTKPTKKSELDMLRESMSKEMRESGIDALMERHFSSPHCLTKRSLAARHSNRQAAFSISPKKRAAEKPVFLPPQISSSAKKVTSPGRPIVKLSQIKLNKSNEKSTQKIAKPSVKQAALLHQCRKLRVRLNRSVVKLYFQNVRTQASNAMSETQLQEPIKQPSVPYSKGTQSTGRGRKRKAPRQIDVPPAKKALITTTSEQSSGRNTRATPIPQIQAPVVQPKTSSQAKSYMIIPRGRPRLSAATPAVTPATASASIEQAVSSQSSKTSPVKSPGKTTAMETDLLTPVSETPILSTTTESSRRTTTKRSSIATSTATTITTTVSSIGKVPRTSSPTLAVPTQTDFARTKQSVPLPDPITPILPIIAPKTEREDECDAAYRQSSTQQVMQANQTSTLSVGPSSSRISPSLSTDSRASMPAVASTLPLVISGATSHSLPPVVIDNAGTRIYSFLHPTKYNSSHGFVMLDYCCPNLDGPMTAIDPTRRHAKVDVAVRELPAYITMETRLVTRAELEADSNALPASIRHKVQRITGSSQGSAPKLTLTTTVSTPSTASSNQTIANTTLTTALASSATISSPSISTIPSTVPASVSALQKQLPSTTTLTPKTMPITTAAGLYKTTPGNGNTGAALSAVAPTATITPTTAAEMRLKLRNSMKKYDILLKKHYPRISLLSFIQRQDVIESFANATQLLPRDIETATRTFQEYVTHMALTTASKPQTTSETPAPSQSMSLQAAVHVPPVMNIANTTAPGAGGIQQLPPVTTRANSRRVATPKANLQRRSVPIYNSDKAVIGYQVQMVNVSGPGSNASTTNSTSFASSASTRRTTKSSTTGLSTSTSSTSTTTTRRSGVFMIDKTNLSAPTTPVMSVANTTAPRMLYPKHNLRTPTSIGTMAHTPQAASTPLSASASIVTRSGGTTSRISSGSTMRQLPARAAATKIQSSATIASPATITPTTSASPLPRLPTLIRNPHLPPLSAPNRPITPISIRGMPGVRAGVDMDQSILQKRLTRKTAATSVGELLIVNHDEQGNPLPATNELILPDESNTTAAAHIKSENVDEF